MLRVLVVLLLALWLTGLLLFKTIGALVHLFLLLAVVFVLLAVIRGRKRS